ncbi:MULTISPECIES: DUF2059 domain-containing protein [unclassified Roseovarius]|uniref:DUF2059 domain-containing protein n=1 Tax=unclassified Roseovarius TaxID=2614913 RepID=UPI00273DA443|nr:MULTISPECIES: DUF2059 domain-containing protein [unclassified Roseovarius]
MIHLLRRGCAAFGLFTALAVPAIAEPDDDIDRLITLLRFEETVEIMHLEGLRYGGEVGRQLIPDVDEAGWAEDVARLYDTENMFAVVSNDFREELQGADIGPVVDYFASVEGQEVIASELAARRVFLDAAAEDAAMARFQTLEEDDPDLSAQIAELIDDSDLIEFNVMGTLNASLMFYRGLRDGGAYDATEDEIFADVWSQEDDTRQSSAEWLGAFLMVAYEPLDPAQLAAYAALYRTAEGREVNRAIFASFDRMYEEISYLMGRAIGDQLRSTPL